MENDLLYLRVLETSDANRLFEIYSNKIAMKYRETKAMDTIDDAYKMLDRDKEVKQAGYEFRYAIIDKISEELIGTVMYQPLKNKAIIGYSIDEKFWKKGFASSVVKLMLNILKIDGFELIEAWVKKENIGSCRVLEKNGFKQISQTIYPSSFYYQKKLFF